MKCPDCNIEWRGFICGKCRKDLRGEPNEADLKKIFETAKNTTHFSARTHLSPLLASLEEVEEYNKDSN